MDFERLEVVAASAQVGVIVCFRCLPNKDSRVLHVRFWVDVIELFCIVAGTALQGASPEPFLAEK
eukprot:SAG31_NODE_14843_length_785_cov_0.848397_2_plen_65_part_00